LINNEEFARLGAKAVQSFCLKKNQALPAFDGVFEARSFADLTCQDGE
jgi:hypothetical protein